MKIVAKQYAQALFSEIKNPAGKDISDIITNFVEILKKDNCLSQMEKIIFYFNEFWKKVDNRCANPFIILMEITSFKSLFVSNE